jgi:anti-anti-sigma factor
MSQSILTTDVQRPNQTSAVVTVHGPLDLGTAGEMEDLLAAEMRGGANHLVLDLSDVAFCDSTGVNALLRVHRRAGAEQGWLRLSAASDQVRRVLQVTHLDRVLRRYPDPESALDDAA